MPITPLISKDKNHDYVCFSDESHSDSKNQYMVIGGILSRTFYAHKLSKDISDIWGDAFPESIQFKNISKVKLTKMYEIVDYIADSIEERHIDFACILFEKKDINYRKFSESSSEGFFKFVYQHHLKWSKLYPKNAKFRCYHGNISTNYDTRDMLRCLNGAQIESTRNPYLSFKFLPVKQTRCLQISDILIGATGHFANKKHLLNPQSAKSRFSKYLADKLYLEDMSRENSDRSKNVWKFTLRG